MWCLCSLPGPLDGHKCVNVQPPPFVCSPWHPGPVECHALRIGGLSGSRETHPGLGERSLFTHPSKLVYNGPCGGEVTGVGTRLFGESPGVLRRLRGSSLE